MSRVALAGVLALGAGAACTGGEPVTELGQVFHGGPGVTTIERPASDGGRPTTEAGTARTTCALSSAARASLLLYFPLDSDATSHAGRVVASATGASVPSFAPGK